MVGTKLKRTQCYLGFSKGCKHHRVYQANLLLNNCGITSFVQNLSDLLSMTFNASPQACALYLLFWAFSDVQAQNILGHPVSIHTGKIHSVKGLMPAGHLCL